MAWATADRANQAARRGSDPIVLANAQRLAATVMRRTQHRDGAQQLMLDTARQLDHATKLSDPTHVELYGQILAAAAYTAAIRDDRTTAWTLLGEAEAAGQRVTPTNGDRFDSVELAVYRISIARVLGDYGTAIDYARLVNPHQIVSPERRARY